MISYDDALANLMAMFPDVDTDTISTVLRDHNGHMERTIDALLVLFALSSFFLFLHNTNALSHPHLPTQARTTAGQQRCARTRAGGAGRGAGNGGAAASGHPGGNGGPGPRTPAAPTAAAAAAAASTCSCSRTSTSIEFVLHMPHIHVTQTNATHNTPVGQR